MLRKYLAVAAVSVALVGQGAPVAAADEVTPVTRPATWITCATFFYAPSTSGDPHAGEVSIDMWSEPFKPTGPLYYQMYRSSYSSYPQLTGALFDEYAAFLSAHLNRSLQYLKKDECIFAASAEEARAAARDRMSKVTRRTMVVPAPSAEMLARAVKYARQLDGLPDKDTADATRGAAPSKPKTAATDAAVTPPTSSAAEIAAERHRAVAERNRLAQEQYQAQLAERQRKLDEYESAKQAFARKQEEQRAAAQAAIAEHQAALAETERKNAANLAAYRAEVEAAAAKARADFDKRHGLGTASTDTDANRCVTTPQTKLNATFQGNTGASVMNGCGQPVDVRICLMTTGGWQCGVTYGLASQQAWSFSAFKATGQVFSDARTSGSNRPLAKPN